jgi:subtilisin family serine protease
LTIFETDRRIDDAKKFMKELERFADKIQFITDKSAIPAWAPWRADKIRIAILDTGIDAKDDILLRTALEDKRIKACCGFLNDADSDPDPADYQDVNGHGTHVTRLVLNAAPSADVFIAKISDENKLATQDFHRITRVSKNKPRKWETEYHC